jgi:DNA modification methylase
VTPHYADPMLTVYLGDVRAVLSAMEPESVRCVISSPPYFGLRDYGIPPVVWGGDPDHEHEWASESRRAERSSSVHWQHTEGGGTRADGSYRNRHANEGADANERREWAEVTTGRCSCGAWLGSLGLEPDPALYIEHVVAVFREVRRVLRSDGTVWLNIGDSYAQGGGRKDAEAGRAAEFRDRGRKRGYEPGSNFANYGERVGDTRSTVGGAYALKAKDRMMMPARVALALQADGWWLRDEIVWHKSNPMPSSVTDRTTPAHEMVYLLTKSARYHYDADAIREPAQPDHARTVDRAGAASNDPIAVPPGTPNHRGLHRVKVPGGWDIEPGAHNGIHRSGRTSATYRDKTAVDPNARGLRQAPEPGEANAFHPLGRNKRSVWTIATQPYPEAHFATFPERLVEPMILAGAPVGAVVLDPFGGSGTTAMVANRLGRKAVHIDLSAEYVTQALERIGKARADGEGPAIDVPVPFAGDGLWAETVA